MLVDCIYVGIGGFVGSVLRYLAGQVAPQGTLPWATLAVNVVGSLVLGALATLVARGILDNEHVSLLLRVGVCGGFTTFSTLSLEAAGMLGDGRGAAGVAYLCCSCVLGVLAALAGGWLVRA